MTSRTSSRSLFAFCTFFAALAPLAGACVSSSTSPSPGAGDSGSGSGGGSGSGSSSSGSGSSSSGSGSGSSSSGSSSSGSSSGGGTDDAGGATCTWSVTGGTTATGSCYAVGVYTTEKNAMEFGVSPLGSASPNFSVAVDLGTTTAAMQPGTYTTTNALNANGTYYSGSGASMAIWIYKDDDGGADGGLTLTITSVGSSTVVDGGTVWNGSHGTLSVTMTPELNATAPITGTATF